MRYDRSGRARQPGGVRRFDPRMLFAAGQNGLIYPTDLAGLFQDGVGRTPATAVNQPLGFTLDMRLGLPVPGPDLVTNGAFNSNLSGWSNVGGVSNSWSAGTAITAYSFANGGLSQDIPFSGDTAIVTVRAKSNVGTGGIWVLPRTGGFNTPNTVVAVPSQEYAEYNIFVTKESGASGIRVYLTVGPGATLQVDSVSVRELPGNHAFQTLAIDRPILQSDLGGLAEVYNGTSSSKTTITGGGSTTGFFWCGALRLTKTGSAQTLFSSAETNTGYRVRINASNQLELAAGNGSAFVTVAASASLAGGERFVLTAWHDGTTLRAQVNNGTIATASMGAVTPGTAQITIGKDNNAASSYFGGWLYYQLHRQTVPTASEIEQLKRWIANRVGVTL